MFDSNWKPVCLSDTEHLKWQAEVTLSQRCTNSRHQVTVATKFCTVVPNVCGFSVYFLMLPYQHLRILRWHIEFWKMSAALPLHALKAYSIGTLILTLTLDGGEWSASCPSCFTPWKEPPITHWIGGWTFERREISCPLWAWTQGHPFHSLVTYTDTAVLADLKNIFFWIGLLIKITHKGFKPNKKHLCIL